MLRLSAIVVVCFGWVSAASADCSCEIVGEPVPLCQGPTWEEAGWGPYQFPRAFVLGDGHVVCSVHVSRDAITNYADPYRWFETWNGGETWQEVSPDIADQCGVRLPNGDVVSFPLENSPVLTGYTFTGFEKRLPDGKWRAPAEGKKFPVPDGARGDLFGAVTYAYLAERLPEEFRSVSWLVRRLKDGALRAENERAAVDWPMLTRVVHARNGFSNPVLKAICPKGDAKIGPDGAIWVSGFSGEGHIDPETRQYSPYYAAELFRSEDGGRTFVRRSHMGYPADGRTYPYASGGFSDNDFEFLADGSMIWFMRSNWYGTTGEEQSPMYVTHSTDMGRTWTPPERFAGLGTFPRVVRLKNGALAVMYGRPGLFVRVCEDGLGRTWSEPLELLTAGDRSPLANRPKANPSFHDWDGECGNGALVPVADDTVLAIYGDFYWPDTQGVKRKTILSQRIRVRSATEPVASWRFDEGDANPVCLGTGARIVSGCGRGKSLRLDSSRARVSAKAVDAVPDISSTERPYTAMIRIRPDADVVSDTMASMAKMCNSRRMTKFVEALRDGQWHHVALVFDPTRTGKEYIVYFDWDDPKSPHRFTSVHPKDAGSKLTLPLLVKNSMVTIGGSLRWGFYSLDYKGLIDDVVLFTTPLASEEIATSIK